ncbi:MAG: LeuA family protein [Planctomycetota bacterium]|nr:LeuA family protein [Planctomycetota bacterium]
MPRSHADDLIYDWNVHETAPPEGRAYATVDDETLRDGLQSASVRHPKEEEMVELLHHMAKLGMEAADIGLPGAGPHVVKTVTRLAKEIRDQKLDIYPNCAARTLVQDIEPIRKISEEVGLEIEVAMFLGTSPIRLEVEGWDVDHLLRTAEAALQYCVDHNMPIMFVTEDTTRTPPDVVRKIYGQALDMGAQRIVVCDTCGHVTPDGTRALIQFVREVAKDHGKPDVQIDWHGHQDRGLGVINSIAAYEAGADRLHAAGLGVGERAGNTPMDQLLVNLKLLGYLAPDRNLTDLMEYAQAVSKYLDVPLPFNYPVIGNDAFETGTGVHAAAVIKALKTGDTYLANRVYSGVPADEFGLEQKISVGPMSGKSNVIYWLEHHGYEANESNVELIFEAAKSSSRVLSDEDLHDLAKRSEQPA